IRVPHVRYTNDVKERFGVNAEYRFGIGGPDFQCCFINGVAHGTEGFQFAGLDRTILIPDQDGDGLVDANESIAFFFDGIAQFGDRDGFDNAFPNGQQIQDVFPNAADREQCEGAFAFVGTCANSIVADFDGVIDFSLAPFNSSFAPQSGRLDNDFVDWRVRLEYDITEDNLAYFLVSTGNKSGGFNDNIPGTAGLAISNPAQNAPVEFNTDTLAPTFGPETLTLFEFGSKNEFQIGEVDFKLNLSGFYYDYDDIQQFTLLSVAQILDFEGVPPEDVPENIGSSVVAFNFNASDAEIYGAQFETGIYLPGDLNFDATLLWLPEARIVNSIDIQDARFQADVDPANAVARSIEGNRLIRTPEIQLNASVSKVVRTSTGQFDGVFSIGYRSSQNQTIFNGIDFNNPDDPLPRLDDRVDGYVTIDMGVGYSHGDEGKYRIEGYVSNLTNVQEPQAIIITQFDNTRFFNTPRLYGVRVRAKF
ncbi:MAG: TonB-dependent receptor, partial [Pseudomonadota bacterium]